MTPHNPLSRYAEVSDGLVDALALVRGERDRLLKESRRDGLTLAELAEATGLTRARVHQITSGEDGE